MKRNVRLNEADLHNIIQQSINNVLNEGFMSNLNQQMGQQFGNIQKGNSVKDFGGWQNQQGQNAATSNQQMGQISQYIQTIENALASIKKLLSSQ